MHDSQTSDDNPLNVVERLAGARWARIPRLSGMSQRLQGSALQEAKQEIKRLQGLIKEEQRRRAVPFGEAFWD